MHQFKVSEWQDTITKEWSVGDVEELGRGSNYWWIPARLLNISLEDWILKLKNEFNAKLTYLQPSKTAPAGILLYHWTNYADAHRYLLWINKLARNNNWTI